MVSAKGHDNKEFSCENSKLHHESWPVKSNPVRDYFKNWGQRPKDTKKGTFSLQKSWKGHP